MKPSQGRATTGFTLLELLVCVAVIAVLASMTAAAVLNARAKARSVSCGSNLRQMGQLLSVFVNDHSRYPMYNATAEEIAVYAGQNGAWFNSIAADQWQRAKEAATQDKYIRSSILACPSVLQVARRNPSGIQSSPPHIYGYNSDGAVSGPGFVSHGLGRIGREDKRPVASENVARPSEMYAIGDSAIGWNGIITDASVVLGRRPDVQPEEGGKSRLEKIHGGKLNMVHCDGHVELLSIQRLFYSTNNEDLARWNREGVAF
ncbi:MAG: prepilin-type N-terminal cleavage/methylation domain-containing protein [Verrucomicrobiae bacterium]|nr:prepilin-type N-terminal cleavage/methylation domain-containing protein [Verrucomicrobiae bacterium]